MEVSDPVNSCTAALRTEYNTGIIVHHRGKDGTDRSASYFQAQSACRHEIMTLCAVSMLEFIS
jgi:hypothetical protein